MATTTTQSSLVAVFSNRSDAEKAASELKAKGFDSGDVYVGSYKEAMTTDSPREWNSTHEHEGGVKGWFKSLFGEEHDSLDYSAYENAADQGGVVVSVQVTDQNLDTVEQILQKYNPVSIDENETAVQATSPSTGSRKQASDNLPASIDVVQEDLRVGKRTVLRGGVRVYSRVVETPVEEKVNLREERVRVVRQPVNRPVSANDLRAGAEQVIEVQEYAEEPVVQKQARVVEEVRVSKDVAERTETVRDTVLRRDVEVEELGLGDVDFRTDFQTRYGQSGGVYEDYEPAYTYGYSAASDPRYHGRSWDDAESDLRTDYGRQHPNSTWEKMKDSIRYGWDKVTGQARSTSAR